MAARPDLDPLATAHAYPMSWDDLCADPRFKDLPYKIEMTAQGRILMSPVDFAHSRYRLAIAELLRVHAPSGSIYQALTVKTHDGERIPDVAWMSPERVEQNSAFKVVTVAPEICVEVIGQSNTRSEMLTKAELYFDAGAKEVWICRDGLIEFLPGPSQLAPDFPVQVEPR
jgi:Uma2 family endonuclease